MSKIGNWLGWHPAPATLAGAALVVLGLLLAGVSWWFVALSGAGAFGPGILRELGWLRDKDEFHRRTAQRAGYHAFLVTGFVAFLVIAFLRTGERQLRNPEDLVDLLLALLVFTWLLSSLLSYWGPRRAASRILIGFGIAWMLFNVADSLQEPMAFVMQSLLALPFFLLALLARRWPRFAGALLLGVAVYLFFFFGFARRGVAGLLNAGFVVTLFLGPLVASGIALLRSGSGSTWEGES